MMAVREPNGGMAKAAQSGAGSEAAARQSVIDTSRAVSDAGLSPVGKRIHALAGRNADHAVWYGL